MTHRLTRAREEEKKKNSKIQSIRQSRQPRNSTVQSTCSRSNCCYPRCAIIKDIFSLPAKKNPNCIYRTRASRIVRIELKFIDFQLKVFISMASAAAHGVFRLYPIISCCCCCCFSQESSKRDNSNLGNWFRPSRSYTATLKRSM